MVLRSLALIAAATLLIGCSGQNITPENSNTPPALSDSSDYLAETPAEFADALSNAKPGDKIILSNGTWKDFDILFAAEGTADRPIQLVAETPGKVVLTGQSSLRLSGNHLIVSGLVFKNGFTPRNEVISFRADDDNLANNSRVTNTVIDGYSNPERRQRDLWVGLYGKNNTFDHNHLSGKMNAGPTLAIRLNTEDSQENRHRITNNYFGPRPVFGSNGGETLRIGTSHFSMTQSLSVVENNYFDRCSGEVEIISNKSGGNTFRGNTFYASRGTLTLRHGNGTTVENNLFDGANAPYTGGVRVINAQQTIQNNHFKNLTGNRFSGALVVMNGVPNSPINRYHQVDGAMILNNTFENIAAIELGEGSDAERTATPANSMFKGNLITGSDKTTPFTLYDDMTGIEFSNNIAETPPPGSISYGFTVGRNSIEGVGASGSFGVAKEQTGVDWYAKASDLSQFEGGREITLQPGTDTLSHALSSAEPGDRYILSSGEYHETKILTIDAPVTLQSEEPLGAILTFERPHMFVLTGHGSLSLDGLLISGKAAPDGKGNSFINTSPARGSGNHTLLMNNVSVEDFNVNGGFSVVAASKGSFFDEIKIENSSFKDVSGTAFKLDEETDDFGIYNAEFVTIKNSTFTDLGGPVVALYRGGTDESTFGPHADISKSTFNRIGNGNAALMVLHGIQKGSFVGNTVTDAQPIALTLTTGLPIFTSKDNQINGTEQANFETTNDMRNRK